MNARQIDQRAAHLFSCLSLWVVAMTLGALLAPDIRHVQYRAGPRPRGEMLVSRIFGSTRAAISRALLVEADRYFHRGVPHGRPDTPATFFSVWADAISPRVHEDLREGDIEEIMPWLRFATLSDPTNVEAYLTTAFWISRADQPARALQVLDEAEMNNPQDYRIFMSRGFHLFEALLCESALANYRKALQLWPAPLEAHDAQARLDRAEILTFTGALLELQGDFDRAIAAFEEVHALAPERHWLLNHIERLRNGERKEVLDFWKGFLGSGGLLGDAAAVGSLVPHVHHETHEPGYCASCRTVH